MSNQSIVYPSFYVPNNVGQLYVPQTSVAYQDGVDNRVSQGSGKRTILLLVDMQVDFVLKNGALSVPGAVGDTQRIIEWIFRMTQAGELDTIAASLDSHVPLQIFYGSWWVNANGEHPAPYTIISVADLAAGVWFPAVGGNDDDGDLQEWSYNYVEALEKNAKKQLMIWPYHTMIGTPGHSLVPALYEAIAYHSGARGAQPQFLPKGEISKTEYYSILEPEIKVPSHEHGSLNTTFLNMLASYDRIYIAGEAKSHCVLETINSVHHYFGGQQEVMAKLTYFMDAMSSVGHPTIDFEAMAAKQFDQFRREGAILGKTTDPVR